MNRAIKYVRSFSRLAFFEYPSFFIGYAIPWGDKTDAEKKLENMVIDLFRLLLLVYIGLVATCLAGLGVGLLALPVGIGLGTDMSLYDAVFNRYVGWLITIYVIGLVFFLRLRAVTEKASAFEDKPEYGKK